MKELIFRTDIENASFYVSSLAIGMLEGMKDKSIPLETGIWSLARPIFWKALEDVDTIDIRLIEWLSSMDELDALQNLDGDAYKIIDELLDLLKFSQQKSLKNNPSLVIKTSIEERS